jgi:hypothetical protein
MHELQRTAMPIAAGTDRLRWKSHSHRATSDLTTNPNRKQQGTPATSRTEKATQHQTQRPKIPANPMANTETPMANTANPMANTETPMANLRLGGKPRHCYRMYMTEWRISNFLKSRSNLP